MPFRSPARDFRYAGLAFVLTVGAGACSPRDGADAGHDVVAADVSEASLVDTPTSMDVVSMSDHPAPVDTLPMTDGTPTDDRPPVLDGAMPTDEGTGSDVPGGACCGGPCGPCGATDYCDYPMRGVMCGATFPWGVCRPRPTSCPAPTGRPVCGCDRMMYLSECESQRAGAAVATPGPCLPLDCAAQDAMGSGGCAAVLGYFWNGSACRAVSGCSCVGRDCLAAYRTVDECRAAYAMCP